MSSEEAIEKAAATLAQRVRRTSNFTTTTMRWRNTMFMYQAIRQADDKTYRAAQPRSERGAGVVEWLAISALSIGLIVVINTAFNGIITQLITRIQGLLGL